MPDDVPCAACATTACFFPSGAMRCAIHAHSNESQCDLGFCPSVRSEFRELMTHEEHVMDSLPSLRASVTGPCPVSTQAGTLPGPLWALDLADSSADEASAILKRPCRDKPGTGTCKMLAYASTDFTSLAGNCTFEHQHAWAHCIQHSSCRTPFQAPATTLRFRLSLCCL